MAKLSARHTNQQTVQLYDFSGGLNTSVTVEGIADNQLYQSSNVEIDHSTNRLKTVSGTRDVFTGADGIQAVAYDTINKVFILVTTGKSVHILSPSDWKMGDSIGTLSGNLYPVFASWEDGTLIASGGKLQYYNGKTLVTIESPNANSVYIRSARVLITDESSVRYSGVGDETNWTDDSNVDSSSKFVEAGYKDGGKFIGMVNLSTDILLIKDNRRVYRLSGDYPNWSISEVSRNVECSGRLSYCAVSDRSFILGQNEVQIMQTTDQYGDVKPANIATLVASDIKKLPANAIVRYVPQLSQVWLIGSAGDVMIYDLVCQGWFKRKFNSNVIDVIPVGDSVYIAKSDRISILDDSIFYDNTLPLEWKFQAKRMVSQHDYLIKRAQISVIPFSPLIYTGEISCGAIVMAIPMSERTIRVWHNYAKVYRNRVKTMMAARNRGVYASGDKVYGNMEMVYGNTEKVFSRHTIIKESRNVFRSKYIDVKGYGSMGGLILNSIVLDIAEV